MANKARLYDRGMSTLKALPPARLRDLIGAEVRAQMGRRNVTQTKLAEAIGMSQQSLSERLRGVTPFTADDIEHIAAALGIHPAILLGGNAPLPPPPTTGRYSQKTSTKRNVPPTSCVVVGTPRELAAVA